MAPEQFQGRWRSYGPPTDLYALGCLTYWLCTGKPPFHGGTLHTISRQHLKEAPPSLQTQFVIPPGLRSWVMKCLRKEPGRRFQLAADARHMLDELRESSVSLPEPFELPSNDAPSKTEVDLPHQVSRFPVHDIGMIHRETFPQPSLPASWRMAADTAPGPLKGPVMMGFGCRLAPISQARERARSAVGSA